MSKAAAWHMAWNADLARYQLGEQTGQGMAVSEVNVERDAWREWLELVPSFSFRGKDGHHFTALKDRRARGGVYWTAYCKINGKLKRRYLGASQEVALARLEHVAAALAEPKIRELQETWIPVPQIGCPQGPPTSTQQPRATISQVTTLSQTLVSDQVQEHVLATKFFVPASPHALFPRPHLDSLLHEGLRRQLTLVSAPAGFGKTTGLSHWVHSLSQGTLENHRVAWAGSRSMRQTSALCGSGCMCSPRWTRANQGWRLLLCSCCRRHTCLLCSRC